MNTTLDDLHLYCRIIELGSLRAAAEEAGTDPSNVTRRLLGLEERMGTRLVVRSRQGSTATDAGRRYYQELKALLDRLSAIEHDISGTVSEPRGLLRVGAPSIFGARYVGPWLHELQSRSKALTIDLVLGDHPFDLVEQGMDVAVRIGALADSSLVAIRLGTMLTGLVAAPEYLARTGVPRTPGDLDKHEFVLHASQMQGARLELRASDGRTFTHVCATRFTVSSILGVTEAVHAGAGINAGPLWLYADAIERGDLVRVLPKWDPPVFPVHALILPGPYRPAKVTAMLDMLRANVPKLPGVRA